jgi:Flp pilus assembly protein TadB
VSGAAAAAAGLLAGAALLTVCQPPTGFGRLTRLGSLGSGAAALPGARRPRPARAARATRSRRSATAFVAVLGGAVVALVLGGVAGLLLGGLVAGLLLRWLRSLEPAQARRRRMRLARDLPWAADLLAAAVEGGAPVDGALRAVAEALGGPLGAELRSVAAALELGAAPGLAWSGVDPSVSGVRRAFVRAVEHGTPPADLVGRLADDLRAATRAQSAAALRTAGVRALAPLGACFLPAFLLLAVLPMVAGVAVQLLA